MSETTTTRYGYSNAASVINGVYHATKIEGRGWNAECGAWIDNTASDPRLLRRWLKPCSCCEGLVGWFPTTLADYIREMQKPTPKNSATPEYSLMKARARRERELTPV